MDRTDIHSLNIDVDAAQAVSGLLMTPADASACFVSRTAAGKGG